MEKISPWLVKSILNELLSFREPTTGNREPIAVHRS